MSDATVNGSSSSDSNFSVLVFVLVLMYVTLFFGCVAIVTQHYYARRGNRRAQEAAARQQLLMTTTVTGGEAHHHPSTSSVVFVDLTDGVRVELMAHVLLVNATAAGANDNNDNNNECPICMERRALTRVEPCDHRFCALCMLVLVNQRKTCPLCRGPITDIRTLPHDEELLAPSSASFA